MIKLLFMFAWASLCSMIVLWAAMALWFHLQVGQTIKICVMALTALVLAAYISVLFSPRSSSQLISFSNVAFICLGSLFLVSWFSMKPSLTRDWAADVQHTVTADVQGDEVTFHNIRDFTWNDSRIFVPRWKSGTYRLSELNSVDVILSYWTHPAIAHTLISFGFADGRHLVFSAEIRKKKGQEFSSLGGFFRSFELAMIAAEERDIIYLRTNVRDERVYRYPVDVDPELMRAMLLKYIEKANDLARNPTFYNTLTSNCTTVVFDLVRLLEPGFPFDYRILLSGYLPEFLYDNELLMNSDLPFSEIQQRALLTPVRSMEREQFSTVIRQPAGT